MVDRTDFNDMNGDIAGEVNSAKTLEEERKEKEQERKKTECVPSDLLGI
jgi:hypothetical protein